MKTPKVTLSSSDVVPRLLIQGLHFHVNLESRHLGEEAVLGYVVYNTVTNVPEHTTQWLVQAYDLVKELDKELEKRLEEHDKNAHPCTSVSGLEKVIKPPSIIN